MEYNQNRLLIEDYGDYDKSEDAHDMNSISLKSVSQNISSLRLLSVGVICGLAGALVDFDHVPGFILHIRIAPVYLIHGFYQSASKMGGGRPFHNLILVLSLIAVMGILTLLFQYNVRMFAVNTIATCKKAIASMIVDQ